MKIVLGDNTSFLTKDGKFDKKRALIDAGVKAGICYRDGSVEDIKAQDSEQVLINRARNAIKSEHLTPLEHTTVGLEITGIPKIMCMLLNNQSQLVTCERSLRYTEVVNNEQTNISDLEVTLYNKWLKIFIDVITENYWQQFYKMAEINCKNNPNKNNLTDPKKIAANNIKKRSQENARYLITVFMPTTMAHTVPWAQINRVACYMHELINRPNKTELQELLVPYMEEFINQLNELDVLDEDFFSNRKQIKLSLFADDNPFSGINLPNSYGPSFSYNFNPSFASFAQFHRHRSLRFEMQLMDNFECYIPPILESYDNLKEEWIKDMNKVLEYYPQGQLIRANINGSLYSLINYVGKERACQCAQLETHDIYLYSMLSDIYDGLRTNPNYISLAKELEPYLGKERCMQKTYTCPKSCHFADPHRKI